MKIALLFSSKAGTAASLRRRVDESAATLVVNEDEGDEPPPSDVLAECDSDETISAVGAALRVRHEVIPIESDEDAYPRLRQSRPDLVFNISERLIGPNREAHIPTLCEILDLPYTGSDPLTLSLCLDKSRAKEILSYHGVPNPEFWIVEPGVAVPAGIKLPAIVKPLFEGSSKGIKNNSFVATAEELMARVREVTGVYRQPVIVERFLSGREFTVGVLGNAPNLEILPIVEIDHSLLPEGAHPIYSYEAKWIWDTPERPLPIFKCPARITPGLQEAIRTIVADTCRILRIRDWCRVDVRLDEAGRPNILEVNPLPGILPNPEDNSCLPKAARTAGYSYDELILRVVDEASLRWGLVGRGGRS
ncbi:MAG: D-alanine--D-alanine ligase [Candidatus Aminicenantes bacterium]|nr:D-alanine--D-alanine ligase [Candidatus Aminicenantes bacterium]